MSPKLNPGINFFLGARLMVFHATFNNTSVILWRECFPLSFIDVDSSNVLHNSFLIVDMKQFAILHYCMDTFPLGFFNSASKD